VFDSGVLVVAFPAIVFCRRHRFACVFGPVKCEIGPFIGKARSVFYFHIETHEFRLKVAVLVDRAFRLRAVKLENEYGFVRPRPVFEEIVIVGGRHKNVGEHLMVGIVRSLLRVAHAVTGGKKNPLAVIRWADQFAVGGKFGFARVWRTCGSGVRGLFDREDCQRCEKYGQID
jgi:hypothetical protein